MSDNQTYVRTRARTLYGCDQCRKDGKLVTFKTEAERHQHRLDVHSKGARK